VVNALRRVAFPLRLAAVRLSHRRGRTALLAAGIAAGAAVLAVVIGGSLVAQDEQTSRALARVPPAQRTVTAVYADLGVSRKGATLQSTEPLVRRALATVTPEKPVPILQYKLLNVGGGLVNLAGMDGVERWVRLRSGRYPRTCTPERCEVVRLGGIGEIHGAPGLRFVEVGEGTLRSPLLFGQLPGAEAARIGENFRPERQPPFVLAEGFGALARLPSLAGFYRTYAWVIPLDPSRIHPWDVDGFLSSVTRARATLKSQSLFLDVAAPTDQLAAARSTGEIAGKRLLLIGGQAAALLLAFALLAAASLRRDTDSAWQRLTWRGARRWQLLLMTGVEAGVAGVLGAVLGWILGSGITAVVAEQASSPAGAVLAHSVLDWAGLGALAALAGGATFVVVLGLRAPALPVGARAISVVDVAALGALLAVLVAVARGQADAGALASSSATGSFLLLLPGLVTFVVAVACARLLEPGLRLLERATRSAAVSVRLAALSLARSPGHSAVAVTFLVASVGLGLFALVYRGTLEHGNDDRAAYEVPLDFVVREDLSPSRLVPPLDAAPLAAYRSLAADAQVVPVLRQTGTVGAFGDQSRFTLLGLPTKKPLDLRGWRDDFADQPLPDLLAALRPQGDVSLRGSQLPEDATELLLPASVVGGDVSLQAEVLTREGHVLHLDLGTTNGRAERPLQVALPPEAKGGRLIALTIGRALAVEQHASEFTRVDGVLRLRPLVARTPGGDRTIQSDYAGWLGVNGATPIGDSAVRYLVNEAAERRFRPRQPSDGTSVPVVVSPRLAAAAGAGNVLPLRVPGGILQTRVVGVADRFPTVSGDFAVADRDFAFTAVNAAKPGSASVNEIWLGADDDTAAEQIARKLAEPPFDVLAVSSRRAIAADLTSDPLSRGAVIVLAGAALGSVLLALLGLLLLLSADIRDERGELFDLEAQGAGPSLLRRHLRLRGALVAGLGLIGGIGTAVALAALVVAVVTVTATASSGGPPLLLHLDALALFAVCAAYALGAAAVVWSVTRGAPR
jgi:ABC-type antimicrobial peptide transport system permease subunit